MSHAAPPSKPLLRGVIHQEAFCVALGACLMLIFKSPNRTSLIASIVYSFGLLSMLGISALYHRVQWQSRARSLWKRLDHSAIFLVIAGSMTPIGLLVLDERSGEQLMIIVWLVAAAGILQSIFWVSAPKWVSAIIYVAAGWLIVPYLPAMYAKLGANNIALLFAGGIFYTVGAIFYAAKRPNFHAGIFGYHELFHAFTVIAAALHFVVMYQII